MDGKPDKVKQLVLEVTSACNLDCVYCYNVWKSPRCNYPRGQLPLYDLLHLIDRLVVELDLETVAITGGEPLLRNDLPQIIRYLWSLNIHTIVITNGSLLTKERIEQLPGVQNYEIPLLSYRREVHDRLTRREAFDRVIQGTLNLRRAKEEFTVAFVATRLNCADLEKTVELAVSLGAIGMLYNRMNVSAYNYQYSQDLLPSLAMIQENLEFLDDFAGRYHFPISSSIPIPPCLMDTTRYKNLHCGFCPLGGEDSYFTVDPLGNLRVCNHSSVILGNLLENSFWDLYQHPYIDQFRTEIPDSCQDCSAAIRDICQGGCKAAGAECFGSFKDQEPFIVCNRVQQTIPILTA